jgi:hypothetical protein
VNSIQYMSTEQNNNLDHNMNPEALHDFVNWLNGQLVHLTTAINEAHEERNFGREAQYQGMRDAFVRCLNKLVKN